MTFSFVMTHFFTIPTQENKMATKRGFKLASANFVLTFLSGTQSRGQSSRAALEEHTNWRGVMATLLAALERNPAQLTEATAAAGRDLSNWVLAQEGGAGLELAVSVKMMDQDYNRQNRNKYIFVHFNDVNGTVIMLNVQKKLKMSSLRSQAAAKVAGCILKKDDVATLEIPRDVVPDIKEAFDDNWRVSYIKTSQLKRKISELTLSDLKMKKDCPYCGRRNFKRILTHVMKTSGCHFKHNSQLEFNYAANNCYW